MKDVHNNYVVLEKKNIERGDEDPIIISCPWCGESFTSFFDYSAGSSSYVEDCQVCCRPIVCHFNLMKQKTKSEKRIDTIKLHSYKI